MLFYQYTLQNHKYINLLVVVVYFVWYIVIDYFIILRYVLILNDYLCCNYLLVLNFILKKIFFFFWFSIVQINWVNKICIFFLIIKSHKRVDNAKLFNKQVVLGLMNFDQFNKCPKLVLIHIVKYSWVDTIQTRHAYTICHP